ncbi:LysE family translocator [Wenyingzhuangia sp. 2_MG-2023]|uniref:LysE family translocator n=1 Tax=Wenyingzhuangia sp. 2_MG-2023 TaxID=3062639 RepID=UPI0026E2A889|nr:LysE family transporter [Wenyingzhuangia sp. 2_MG-2023]MDO6738642.1 LysE family transporter [Wenyingzhuangia sp. 2_MG-2023]
MNFYELKNAIFLGIFLSFMIGPVFFMLLQTSILRGAKVALAFNTGVILGDITFILISYYGSRPILEKIKDDPRLFLLGGIILILYGLVTVFTQNKKNDLEKTSITIPEKNNYFRLILHGFFLNCINVGVLAFWLGLIVVVIPTLEMNPTQIFWYFATIVSSYFVTDVVKIILAKQLKSKLTSKNILVIKKIMGIVLILFGTVMVLKGVLSKEHFNIGKFLHF